MRSDLDSRFRQLLLVSLALLAALALAVPAQAIPLDVAVTPAPGCDSIPPPGFVDELGNPPAFPPDEAIASTFQFTEQPACPPTNTAAPNVQLSITNLTAIHFTDLWYVSDPETSLSNADAYLVNGEEAFKIDRVGINVPLLSESLSADQIFQPGETWVFVIDDYFNALGLPASALASAGRVGALSGGDPTSSGSIIAIPEPGTLLLGSLGLAGLALLARRRLKV
jgi:hypothetical protein